MTIKIDFHFDFETRSRLDLRKVGAVKYATHPSTEATLLTWCFGRTGTVKAWRYGQPLPEEIVDVLVNPQKYMFNAWNVAFDYMVWVAPFFRQAERQGVRGVRPSIFDITDSMALSQRFRLGGSLESCARFLNLPMSKDKIGRRIMLKQCKPDRTGSYPTLTAQEWKDFERYGILDTVILREAYYRLPQLPAAERWIFEWSMKRNLSGINVDVDLIRVMDDIIKKHLPKIEDQFRNITGLSPKSPKCKEWFKPYFPWIDNMQSDTVREMLIQLDGKPAHVVEALRLKDLAGSTSISKVSCAVNMLLNGKIYDLFAYHMAQTKRFAGRGIQIQNFPRPNPNPKDALPDLSVDNLAAAVESMSNNLNDPIDFVKNLLRRIWIAPIGKRLYCGDFSKVEPTVLYWLTGMGAVPKLAYEMMASEIYSKRLEEITKDGEERQIGKSAVLGGGYGMGWKKFRDQVFKQTGIRMDDEFSKHVIKTYRRVNAPITEFWRDLQAAFRRAIGGDGTVLCEGKIHVMPMPRPWKGVQIRLPSGSYLYYHNASVKVEQEMVEIVEIVNNLPIIRKVPQVTENLYYDVDMGQGKIAKSKIYGGLLCEHVTSATARDLLCFAMYNLDQAGFDVLATIHDEIWGAAEAGRDEEYQRVMCILPHWCPDLVLTSDGESGVRYLK